MIEKEIITERLIIKDSKGEKRIELSVDNNDNPSIKISPSNDGMPLINMGILNDRPYFSLRASGYGINDKKGFIITQIEDNFRLSFHDGKKAIIDLAIDNEESPYLTFYDKDTESPRLSLYLNNNDQQENTGGNGSPRFEIFNKSGDCRARFSLQEDFNPQITFYDSETFDPRMIILQSDHDGGHPGILTKDKEGEIDKVFG